MPPVFRVSRKAIAEIRAGGKPIRYGTRRQHVVPYVVPLGNGCSNCGIPCLWALFVQSLEVFPGNNEGLLLQQPDNCREKILHGEWFPDMGIHPRVFGALHVFGQNVGR